MNDILSQIKSIADQGETSTAIEELDRLLKTMPNSAEAYLLRGKLKWKLGKRQEAISDYLKSDELNPGGAASRALEMARDIEGFFNPDLLNP